MSITAHSFTPVRRRQCSFKTEAETTDTTLWTAARCNRLLRALKSRVKTLEKDAARLSSANPQPSSQPHNQPIQFLTPEITNSLKRSDSEERDPDWGPSRKKVRKTYSNRGRPKKESSGGHNPQQRGSVPSIPGEILVPTPILSRMVIEPLCSNSSQIPDDTTEECARARLFQRPKHSKLKDILRKLKKEANVERYALYGGIYNALEALLRATTPAQQPEGQTRPKSLFSMCLRQVPTRIKQEETWDNSFAEEQGLVSALEAQDVSAEIYSELESLGSSEKGWKHLREVARSHGVQIVCQAIKEGLVSSQFSGTLASLCLHTEATREAELLLDASLSAFQYPEPTSTSSHLCDEYNISPLSTLKYFVQYTGRADSQYRILANSLSSGKLPLSWIATKEFGGIWTEGFGALSSSPPSRNATIFMETVLSMICINEVNVFQDQSSVPHSNMKELLQAAFSSVLATLCAIDLLGCHSAEVGADSSRVPSPHHRQTALLLRRAFVDSRILSKNGSRQLDLLAISNLILSVDTENTVGSGIPISNLVEALLFQRLSNASTEKFKEQIVAFLCTVVRSCGRGSSTDGFEQLDLIIQRLQSHMVSMSGRCSETISGMMVDMAYAFAHEVPKRAYLEYAQDLGTRLQGPHIQPRSTPNLHSTSAPRKFRWEEGIEEWVTATPSVLLKKAKVGRLPALGDELEHGTPLKAIRSRHRVEDVLGMASKSAIRTKLHQSGVSSLISTPPRIVSINDMGGKQDISDESLIPGHNNLVTSGSTTCSPATTRTFGRLTRREPQTRGTPELSDDSDDELNSSTFSISEVREISSELGKPFKSSHTQRKHQSRERSTSSSDWGAPFLGEDDDSSSQACRKKYAAPRSMRTPTWGASLLEDSEDELCL